MRNSSSDLTLLFITAGETPPGWANFHLEQIEGYPRITVSRKAGADLHDTEPKSYENIYRQMLRAAKLARTPYVAMVEDDVLYSREHFDYRPPMDTFAYNQHRWALFTWGEPIYSMRNRKSNCSLIAPTALLIEALEERFAKHPHGWPEAFAGELGRDRVERGLGVTLRKSVEFYSSVGIVQLNHEHASEPRQRTRRKSLGPIKAYDIPYWGRAQDILRVWT